MREYWWAVKVAFRPRIRGQRWGQRAWAVRRHSNRIGAQQRPVLLDSRKEARQLARDFHARWDGRGEQIKTKIVKIVCEEK